jgi:hypothetical protein
VFVDPSGARPRWTRRAFAALTIPLGGFLVVTATGFHGAGLAGGTWGLPALPILSSEPGGAGGAATDDESEDEPADERPMTALEAVGTSPYLVESASPAILSSFVAPGADAAATGDDASADVPTGQSPAPSPASQQSPSATPTPASSPSGDSTAPAPGPTPNPTAPPGTEPAPDLPPSPDPDPDTDPDPDAGPGAPDEPDEAGVDPGQGA